LATPPNDLKNWLDETILMPKIKGVTWAELADDIRDGSVAINNQQRLALVGSLSALMLSLENNQISHRDLSSTNIMIDKSTLSVSLIDWDCMYHPSISMPKNTTFGTEGYISPFVYKTGNPITTWKEKSDRFSLAVFNVEFLGLAKGSPLAHDGGMFEQTKICMTNVYTFAKLLSKAQTDFPFAITLFERALNAKTFDDCPAPSEWFAFTGMPSVAPGPSISPPPPPIITPSPPPRPVFTSIYSTIKYCPRCGADRDDDYSNCPACGLYVAYMA
jgi:serine/threonine protein kinase